MTELKPCPFCNGVAVVTVGGQVECTYCGLTATSVKNWNTRISPWLPIEQAPRDGTEFLAMNYDGELWKAMYDDIGRLCYRTHERYAPHKYSIETLSDGRIVKILVEPEEEPTWENNWTIWQDKYDFKPTHFTHLPEPPEREEK